WIYGEKVDDVTAHPAFRNAARSVARLYDALHDPEHRDVLTVETDTGSGGVTHPLLPAPPAAGGLVRGPGAVPAPAPPTHRPAGPWATLHLRLEGPPARLQGGFPRDVRPERGLLRPVRGDRAPLVPRLAGAHLLHNPPARDPAGRPEPGHPRGGRHLHPRGRR